MRPVRMMNPRSAGRLARAAAAAGGPVALVAATAVVAIAATSAGSETARLSANGRIAFESANDYVKPGEPGGPGIYLVNPDGTRQIRLRGTGAQDRLPVWSPDGTSIAFVREGSLYVMAGDGTGQHRIVSGVEIVRPTWAPDGRRIAFVRGTNLWLASADGSDAQQLTAGTEPAWSPDGTRIAFVRGGQLATIGTDGSNLELLQGGDLGATGTRTPTWSPEGSRIAVVQEERGAVGIPSPIVIVNLAQRKGRYLLVAGYPGPVWSPDALQIAYTTTVQGQGPYVFTAEVNGSKAPREVVAFGDAPSWQPCRSANACRIQGDPDLDKGSGCTILGTDGNDRIVGTSEPDVICARGGNDVIRGGGGDDSIIGGKGIDTIDGGVGNDQIKARDGKRDVINGGPGRDVAWLDYIRPAPCRKLPCPHNLRALDAVRNVEGKQ
jgi:Ca2+-binding RTX toxin-like protein